MPTACTSPVRESIAVLQWTNGDDISGSSSQHAFGFIPNCENLARTRSDGDNRRLAQNDALILDINEGICRTQVDADIVRK
jgi:hypothetical protein